LLSLKKGRIVITRDDAAFNFWDTVFYRDKRPVIRHGDYTDEHDVIFGCRQVSRNPKQHQGVIQ